ncbi:Chondrolectin [Plecturocebus cupreus]
MEMGKLLGPAQISTSGLMEAVSSTKTGTQMNLPVEVKSVLYHQPTANPGLGGPYLYQWNDDRGNMKHNYICKYEPEINPTVSVEKPYLTNQPGDTHQNAVVTEAGIIPNLIYVVIPTILLLLLILVAFGTCCFQMLHKSKGRTKTSPNQSTLWISKSTRKESGMEV